MAIRSAKGKMVDFDDLKARANARAQQDEQANESAGLSRPSDTFIPPQGNATARPAVKKPVQKAKAKKSESDVASEILDELKTKD
jgi:hypothetical protein